MAAYSTGASWSFDNLPGGWKHEDEEPVTSSDEQRAPSTEDSPAPPLGNANQTKRRRHWPPRTCRICLEGVQPTFTFDENSNLPTALQSEPRVTYESEDGGRLIRPCKCKGSQKYVHEECLGAWRRADPLQKRNYWECPTCRYRYQLQRLAWGTRISSTAAQLALTGLIFVLAMFLLGFVADPIINAYLDPVSTITTGGGPTGSLLYEDEPASWTEHFVKGLASLGLLGFAKFLLSMSPFHWLRFGGGGTIRSGVGGTGRDRMRDLSWIAILVGVATFLYAVWKGVRAWSRRVLESASERVMDVQGDDDDEED